MQDIQVFLGFANSWIATPLTSILKTLSIKLAKPKKGIVGVGDGGKNRAEPVGKHEVDGVDDGDGRNVILTGSFIQGFSTIAVPLTLILKASSLMHSSTSATQSAVK